jgi:hypothetical protein
MQIISGNLKLIKYNKELIQILFDIRNALSVRRYLKNPRKIIWEDHKRWVKDNLIKNQTELLFIVYWFNKPCGIAIIRNISTDKSKAEIGLMIRDASKRPLCAAYAGVTLCYLAVSYYGIKKLFSKAFYLNEKAININKKGGAKVEYDQISKEYYYEYTPELFIKNKYARKILAKVSNKIKIIEN